LRAIDGLASWQVYFYQGNGWSNCQSTGNVVAAPVGGASGAAGVPPRVALPMGVRIVLDFAPGSGQNGMLTRDTLLGP
jgi:general secretion pathway protein J